MTTDTSLEPVNMTSARETRKRGFTLTEIAIVLGIIGLILGAIWVAAAAVYNNLRVSHANTEILQIAQGIRALYATSPNNGGVTALIFTTAAITANAVPSDMVLSASTLNDPWANGTTIIGPSTDANLSGFYIEMTNVPQAACINLLQSVAGSTRDPGLFWAGSATVSAPTPAAGSTDTSNAGAVTAAATVASSTAACTTALNTIYVGFALKS